jgi:hypothetical protein
MSGTGNPAVHPKGRSAELPDGLCAQSLEEHSEEAAGRNGVAAAWRLAAQVV